MASGRSVLLVTNIFPPQIGGPATFISTLASQLARERNCRVSVVCSSEARADVADAERPFRVHRLDHRSPYRYHLQLRLTLMRELLRHDVVLVNGLEQSVFPIARLLMRRFVVKVVGDSVWQLARNSGESVLDIDAFQQDSAVLRRHAREIAARRQMLEYAQLVVTPSNYLRRLVIGWGISSDRVITIPNGIDLERFGRSRSRRINGMPLRALFVGRLTNWKGVETLLLATSRVESVETTIVGDGPGLPYFRAFTDQLGLGGRVSFAGRLTQTQVAERMASSDVLVLTSLYEGMSHTLQEALASGLPCIAANRGGNDEVIHHGREGLLVEPQDVNALAVALRFLSEDEPARSEMSRNARDRSQAFSIQATAAAFASALLV